MNPFYVRPSRLPEQYMEADLARKTKYKSVENAYQRNLFSVIRRGSIFYIEGSGCSNRTYNLILKEMKRLYPELTYLHDPDIRR